jgi:vancomycin permeability regulator SanA
MLENMMLNLKTHNKTLFILIAVCALLPALAISISYVAISPNNKYILNPNNALQIKQKHAHVGLVLGAGVTNQGKPYKELQARLDVAADALNRGYVDELLLSGDNRFKDYDEPTAMQEYLVQKKHISKDKLHPDFAGRSTYASCERADKVFGLKNENIIIFSAESHLPRAIFLCRHFDIQAYGIASNLEANNSTRREALARVKAMLNVYVRGEQTVLGAPIKI